MSTRSVKRQEPSLRPLPVSFTPVGVDIAKQSFSAAILSADGEGRECYRDGEFSNSPQGFTRFGRWLRKQNAHDALVLMEATGELHLGLATYLHEQAWVVSVINPSCIHNHAKSQLQRNKTDPVDARLIAHYCKTQPLRLWTPQSPEQQELQSLTRYLEELKTERTRQQNRLGANPAAPATRRSLEKHIGFLNDEIAAIEQAIADLFSRCQELAKAAYLLQSIPGVGWVTAVTLLAELPDLRLFTSARQLAAYAGLSPAHRQSGKLQKRTPISKQGNRRMRTALSMAGVSARRHNPLLVLFADRLAAKGHAKMSIIAAVMRKLLHQAYGILKSGQPFDPNFLAAAAA